MKEEETAGAGFSIEVATQAPTPDKSYARYKVRNTQTWSNSQDLHGIPMGLYPVLHN